MNSTASAVLHDGSSIPITIRGRGRSLLLPARLEPHSPAEAEEMRRWGADPDLGPAIVDGLSSSFRVITADYERHRMSHPAADTLTPDAVAADLAAIADAAGASTFGYYGYSWLALCGLQFALRTDRLWALAMGGFPPIDGPYESMLAVTRAAHAAARATRSDIPPDEEQAAPEPGDWDSASIRATEEQTRQFVTLYEALQDFDDRTATLPRELARLAFAGSADRIDYSEKWGGVQVRIGDPLVENERALVESGWTVRLLDGLDHLGAMHSRIVLPLLTEWFGPLR
jgi:hypothetical protein